MRWVQTFLIFISTKPFGAHISLTPGRDVWGFSCIRRDAVKELIHMARGGARNRSGPQPDPSSGRSDRRGLAFGSLPAGGFAGAVPEFPLPESSPREMEVWGAAWRTPQADAWSRETWRHRTVALWVRYSVRMEAVDASAALGNVVQRLADQIGMTPAGLKENGWTISDGVTAPVERPKSVTSKPVTARRLRSVDDAAN